MLCPYWTLTPSREMVSGAVGQTDWIVLSGLVGRQFPREKVGQAADARRRVEKPPGGQFRGPSGSVNRYRRGSTRRSRGFLRHRETSCQRGPCTVRRKGMGRPRRAGFGARRVSGVQAGPPARPAPARPSQQSQTGPGGDANRSFQSTMHERSLVFLRCGILRTLLLLYYLAWVQVGDNLSYLRTERRIGLSSFACT